MLESVLWNYCAHFQPEPVSVGGPNKVENILIGPRVPKKSTLMTIPNHEPVVLTKLRRVVDYSACGLHFKLPEVLCSQKGPEQYWGTTRQQSVPVPARQRHGWFPQQHRQPCPLLAASCITEARSKKKRARESFSVGWGFRNPSATVQVEGTGATASM